jgi:hypothetical protein
MTRLQKKILGEMLQTIKGAIGQANVAIRENDANKLQSLLSACQESAVAVGTEIEGIVGEGTQTVAILEAFCEEVYNASVKADSDGLSPDLTKEMTAQINEASKIWEEEISVKSTVLFLPCEPKWWDGFETVWRREKDTPDTTVFVVPIPWYEKRIETGEVIVHYNPEAYPKEIGALDYNSFDIQKLHPDIIYIQEAGDGETFACWLDMRFYTSSLKPCTDDLVYIPYRIEREPDVKNRDQLDKLAANILVKGIDNVDTIVVQSPNMRNAYINILRRRDRENGVTEGQDWPSIIRGTGSPRAEKVASLKKEDFDIPQDWLTFIQRPDGSRKKIMLYGNSVYTFMNSGISIIEKIRDSFQVFKENAEDVALIWRPHPEARDVIAFLRPELLEEYDALVKEFVEEKLGILDEDDDFTRSVVLSDAFYGDDSALITIYKATGKPIMIENLEIRSNS